MTRHPQFSVTSLLLAACLIALPTLAEAGTPSSHDVEAPDASWYIGVEGGLGLATGTSGSTVHDYSSSEMSTPGSVSLLLGATLGPSLLIGGELGFTAAPFPYNAFEGMALTRVDGVATWFPSANPLFLRGKVGLAHLSMSKTPAFFDTRISNQYGLDLGVGAGLAFPLGSSFRVTGALDLGGQWYGGAQDGPTSSHALTLMIGFGWY